MPFQTEKRTFPARSFSRGQGEPGPARRDNFPKATQPGRGREHQLCTGHLLCVVPVAGAGDSAERTEQGAVLVGMLSRPKSLDQIQSEHKALFMHVLVTMLSAFCN